MDSNTSVEWQEFLAFALPSGKSYGHIKQLWEQLLGGQASSVAAEVEAMDGSLQVAATSALCTHSRCHLQTHLS